ncbi:hypothetical protein FEM03_07770 [Phragmitibacter flavus]|uniref:Uncharacterized protein n=1 Tax=Phragmitibacter flavus TaxID=2576071 RepID=A0A5R8KGJ0_9BACT|nr:hypothetical protein [Phragmitibacter flavus]TLD71416.1 hypothetical protein FEM03_07770 [Phragmitibacter flavus]
MSDSALFADFKRSFDHYLDNSNESPAEMLFLRYESELHFPEDVSSGPEPLSLDDYFQILDQCQQYAISREVTSTYVFFNPEKFQRWAHHIESEDTTENRARWAHTQIQEQVVTHVSSPITYFIITGHPEWYKVLPENL